MDIHSHARPDSVRVKHVSLELDLDFERQQVAAAARLEVERIDRAPPLVLDSSALIIDSVVGADGTERRYSVSEADPNIGSAVTIDLNDTDDCVNLRYRTVPEAAALQWLEPSQTAGGRLPFLYTQGQAILTRSWIPLQDSPGVRTTFDAIVRAPEQMRVVMSAAHSEQTGPGTFYFRMEHPIPPYLLALACGEIAFEPVSERCGVYAEPAVVRQAAAELEDMEQMVVACEGVFGPYLWGRYDVLILPPSFPFGGMENPTVTFATPTILAGDKSLVSLIAHELAHSWSGNLATNATWSDFWLNEGFTVYLEQRIMEIVYGTPRYQMEILIGLRGLEEQLKELPLADQVLHIDLSGRNPDDGMTAVPYDKGAAFLRRLEQAYGRERFDRFLAGYFQTFSFQSITTETFVDHLREHLLAQDEELASGIDLQEWIHGSGLPDDLPAAESPAFDEVDCYREGWLAGAPPADVSTDSWITHQWLHFIDGMPQDVEASRVREMEEQFGFVGSGNSELRFSWLRLALRRGVDGAFSQAREFLLAVGRRKFLEPLYKEMVKTEEGTAQAQQIYREARPLYHSISRRTIDNILRE